jgi:hypothetical protein
MDTVRSLLGSLPWSVASESDGASAAKAAGEEGISTEDRLIQY